MLDFCCAFVHQEAYNLSSTSSGYNVLWCEHFMMHVNMSKVAKIGKV